MERCPVCGGTLDVVRDQPYQYTESGLNVILIGITQYTCGNCEETFASIPNPEQLHTTIALDICKNKKALLLPKEVRFLRKELCLKSKELAMAMGVKPEQVSRWENGKASIAEGNDRMLRMIYRASVEKPCSDVSAKDRVISFLTSLPTKRKQIDEAHVIELNPQEWMRPVTACC
jgi:putative zinc finger/helix-turn-helix YgiT family protein